MPSLKPRHEAFCRYYVTHLNAAEAARAAGYSERTGANQGYRLLRRPAVAARLAELRDEIAARDCLTLGAQLSKLEAAYRAALAKNQPAAAAAIIRAEVALPALFATSERADKGDAAVAELRAQLAQMAKALGLPAPAPAK